jgi:ribosomal protein L29
MNELYWAEQEREARRIARLKTMLKSMTDEELRDYINKLKGGVEQND